MMMFISIEITEFEKCMGNWKNFDGDDLHAVYYYCIAGNSANSSQV